MDLLYKYFAIDEDSYSITNLCNELVVYNSLFTFNDPFEGIGQIVYKGQFDYDLRKAVEMNLVTDKKNQLISNYRIFCITEHYNNPLMWAHYAAKHTGFCVGYKKGDVEKISTTLQKVTYSAQPPSIKSKSVLFTKSKEWEYENEWRAIYKLTENDITHLEVNTGNHDYKTKLRVPYIIPGTNDAEILESEIRIMRRCSPQVVYLGLRIGMANQKRITDICKKLGIPVYQMQQSHNSFSLTAQLV